METSLTASFLVPLHFIHLVVGPAILAWWFMSRRDGVLKNFGMGMLGYALGTAAWALLVLTKPDDLRPLIIIGVIPFLLAHIPFAKAAYHNISQEKRNLLIGLVVLSIVGTFVARTFFFPSEAFFSEEGLLFFGLDPVAIGFYIMLFSISFLPAVLAVVPRLPQSARAAMNVGLIAIYVTSVVMVSAQDGVLLLMNGWVAGLGLLLTWVTALRNKGEPAAPVAT